jgi:sugar lactone lactonase YvrE
MTSTEAAVYFRPVIEARGYLPEGPRVARVRGKDVVAWVNIQAGAEAATGSLLWCHTDEPGDDHRTGCPYRPGFLLPVEGGDRVLVGHDKELRVYDLATGDSTEPLAAIPDDNPRTIINDAEVVPGGRAVVFGTKDVQFKDSIANLYLYTVGDNRVSVIADRQTCSNGKVLRTDDRGLVLLDIDTPTRKVVRYRLDVAARTATPDGDALDLSGEPGFPDGMCDCGDGTVIVAFYNPDPLPAGRAVRFDLATSSPLEEWTTPGSPRVTCPLLVKRPDGVKLVLTTAAEGMSPALRAKSPNAGCLFIADTRLKTCPEPWVVRLGT